MKILLDTHALLWYLNDDVSLSSLAKRLIEDQANAIFVSIASLWEITIKLSLGRLHINIPLNRLDEARQSQGIGMLPITVAHLEQLYELPFHHHDPFDRLLIAQAMKENMTILSRDFHFAVYPANVLWE